MNLLSHTKRLRGRDPQPEILQICFSASRKSCLRATRHRRGHDSTLAVSTSSYSQCAREHSADIPDGHMLLLPSPPSISCWHSMPVRVDKNRRADKGEWHAMLAQCAPPSVTTMKKQ